MKRLKILLTAIVVSSAMPLFSTSQSSYFSTYQPLADSLENLYGIPSSVILAIAYHESAGGKSRNAKLLNNHFGIKGSNNLKRTHGITSKYKQYASVTDSYFGFCKLIQSKPFFHSVKGSTDVVKWINSISNCGYASGSKTWPEKIKWIIKQNKLG